MLHSNFKSNTMKTMVLIGVITSGLVISCAQKREAKLSEEASRSIFSRSLFQDKDIDVELENAPSENKNADDSSSHKVSDFQISSNSRMNKVVSNSADPKIQFMFKNLKSANFGNSKNSKFSFRVSKQFITGFAISSAGDISSSLKSFSIVDGSEVLTPIFKYKIESYGLLKAKKNELGQETSSLDLVPCDWDEATHIKLTPTADARLIIESPMNGISDKPVYSLEKLTAKTFSLEQLKELFGLDFDQFKAHQSDQHVQMKLTDSDTLSLVSDNTVIGTINNVKCLRANSSLNSDEDTDSKIEWSDVPCDSSHSNDNLIQLPSGTKVQPAETEHKEEGEHKEEAAAN